MFEQHLKFDVYNKYCIILINTIYFLLFKILNFYSPIIFDAIKLVNIVYISYCYLRIPLAVIPCSFLGNNKKQTTDATLHLQIRFVELLIFIMVGKYYCSTKFMEIQQSHRDK